MAVVSNAQYPGPTGLGFCHRWATPPWRLESPLEVGMIRLQEPASGTPIGNV